MCNRSFAISHYCRHKEATVPSFRKVDPAEIQVSAPRPFSERTRIALEYDALLEGFAVGDHGRADLGGGERRVSVRQRLQAAARRRNLVLRFRPGRGTLIFRVDVAPRPPEIIPSAAVEAPDRANDRAGAQRGPEQGRPRRERQPAAGRYDAVLPRWMREGSQSEERGKSKRRAK
jgi:hypothetical protein